jgi:hypothetical protein
MLSENRYLGTCFSGIVVNTVFIGHITSLDPPQNGHATPCGASFTQLVGPETLNVLRHFVQVTIFSILNSLLPFSLTGLTGLLGRVVITLPRFSLLIVSRGSLCGHTPGR